MVPVNLYVTEHYMLIPGSGGFLVSSACRRQMSMYWRVCRQTNKFLPLRVSSENIQRLPHSTVVVSFALTVANWLSFSPVPIIRSNFYCLPACNVITACVGVGGLLNWFVTLEYMTASIFSYLINCEWVSEWHHHTWHEHTACFVFPDRWRGVTCAATLAGVWGICCVRGGGSAHVSILFGILLPLSCLKV
jgi:hypothetical protein